MAPSIREKTNTKKKAASLMSAAKVTKRTKRTNSKARSSASTLKTVKVAEAAEATAKAHGRQETATHKVQDHPSAQDLTVVPEPLMLRTDSILGELMANYHTNTADDSAQYDEIAGHYALDSHMVSDKPFAMERTVVQSGVFKGYQALILVPIPKNQFRFQDLPIEIRLMVYHEAFTNRGLQLRAEGRVGPETRGAWVAPNAKWHDKPKPKSSKTRSLAPFNINLLLASSWVFKEAAPVFYSNNIHVNGWKGLQNFLEPLSSCRQFVQNITISGSFGSLVYSPRVATKMAPYLAEATALKNLRLTGGTYPPWNGIQPRVTDMGQWLVGHLKPVLQRLHEQGKNAEDILRVIVWDAHDQCWYHRAVSMGEPGIGAYPAHPVEGCEECARYKRSYEVPMDELKAKIVAVLEEKEHKPQAASRLMSELSPRRDTGRPKREGVTDKAVSYAESDDGEMGDIAEDGKDEDEDESEGECESEGEGGSEGEDGSEGEGESEI